MRESSSNDDDNSTTLLAHATSIKDTVSSHDIYELVSTATSTNMHTQDTGKYATIDGNTYMQCNMSKTYHVSNHTHNKNIPIFSPSLSGTKLCGNCYTCLDKEYYCKLTFNVTILSNQVKAGLILATKMSVH